MEDMDERCPACGGLTALIGRVHNCRPWDWHTGLGLTDAVTKPAVTEVTVTEPPVTKPTVTKATGRQGKKLPARSGCRG